ncbi:hypothetical protein GA0115251_12539, partial [Streptomyces sp. TverLS-915]
WVRRGGEASAFVMVANDHENEYKG